MKSTFDPNTKEQINNYYQRLASMHEWYKQSILDAAASSAAQAWNAPIRQKTKRRPIFRIRLPISLLSVSVSAGVALWKTLRSRKAYTKPVDVIDLYSEDQIVWKPSNRDSDHYI